MNHKPGTICIVIGHCCEGTARVLGRIVTVVANVGIQRTDCPWCQKMDVGLAVVTDDCEWDEGYLESWLKPLPSTGEVQEFDREEEFV